MSIRRLSRGLLIPCLLTGCRAREMDYLSVVGCYAPALHPEVQAEVGKKPIESWMFLDSIPEARAIGPVAYRVRIDPALVQGSLWTGWWRPVSSDSIEVVWSAVGFTRSYTLAVRADSLIGGVKLTTDLGAERHPLDTAVSVKSKPRDSSRCRDSK